MILSTRAAQTVCQAVTAVTAVAMIMALMTTSLWTSCCQCLAVNLIKCAAGCGMFSLPYAYKQGGLYMSIGGTLFFGAISAYTVSILAAAEMKARHFPVPNTSANSTPRDDGQYTDKGEYAEYVHPGTRAIARAESGESLEGLERNLQAPPQM